MIVRNDYNNCITNLACSIQKYFNIETRHNSLAYIDELLEKYEPDNVVVILYDGMGSRLLNKLMPEDSFFRRNMKKEITTVFPATTTAVINTIQSGLNPVEHGWLGWDCYVPQIDKVITLFRKTEKRHDEICPEFVENEELYHYKSIVEQINETGTKAYNVSPYGDHKYESLEQMADIIEDLCSKPGKKYVYAYNNDPDSTMHHYGCTSDEAIEAIKRRNDLTERLAEKLHDALLIVIADHGHIDTENYFLEDYEDVQKLLERPISIEPRAVSFKVKEGCNKQFEELFNKYFAPDFRLYSAQEVIDSQLFGDGQMHQNFRSSLGDYLAIATDSNKTILPDRKVVLKSQHAGYTDDEIFIPLIVYRAR